MKISEFYPALTEATEKLGLTWEESGSGCRYLRARRTGVPGNMYCPITAVCEAQTNEDWSPSDYQYAAGRIGLGESDAIEIAESADARLGSEYRYEVRRELERAMGLAT